MWQKFVISGFVAWAGCLVAAEPEVASKVEFIENGKIKIGADLSSGGAIFWFSELPDGPNLLNHADRGRFIQQSYYGAPDGSKWGDKDWRWNPVQGGHYQGRPAKVLEQKKSPTQLYVKSMPVNWAGGEIVEECQMEEWISLQEDVATIRFRFAYSGEKSHPPVHQELPAVFVDFALTKLVHYAGKKPWTGGHLSESVPGWPNESRRCDEEWAAFIGPDGRGLGVHFPGTKEITCYRFDGPAGPKGSGCSYFAPVQTMAITPGFVHDYSIKLKIGTPAQIRAAFSPVPISASQGLMEKK